MLLLPFFVILVIMMTGTTMCPVVFAGAEDTQKQMYNYSYDGASNADGGETISQKDKEYKDWTADWWKWVLSYSYQTLFLDQDGSNIVKYQPDNNKDVYFLTGAYNADQIRNVTIPAGKHVLVPILNGIYSCMDCSPIDTFGLKERLIDAGHIDTVQYLESRLDGSLVPYTRITSDLFDAAYRNDSAYNIRAEDVGKSVPTISDGYWTILEPDQLLPVGSNHSLLIHSINKNGYSSEATYNIQVISAK